MAILEGIRNSQPDILLVAMGAPKQDIWLHDYLDKSGAYVGIGVGGPLISWREPYNEPPVDAAFRFGMAISPLARATTLAPCFTTAEIYLPCSGNVSAARLY